MNGKPARKKKSRTAPADNEPAGQKLSSGTASDSAIYVSEEIFVLPLGPLFFAERLNMTDYYQRSPLDGPSSGHRKMKTFARTRSKMYAPNLQFWHDWGHMKMNQRKADAACLAEQASNIGSCEARLRGEIQFTGNHTSARLILRKLNFLWRSREEDR
jgi:hypothetical protein